MLAVLAPISILNGMEQRFNPDNTEETKAQRKANLSWGGALVREHQSARWERAYDHALAWIVPVAEVVDLNANVVELRPDHNDLAA